MRRTIPFVSIVTFVSLLALPRPSVGQSPAAEKQSKEKAKREQEKKDQEKKAPKVYTNDDLEATSERPSAVQNATAQGAPPPPPPREPSTRDETSPEPTPLSPSQEISEQDRRIKEAEENIKALDQAANALLWQYLQSTDTYEILRLKGEQQEILDQLEKAKAELARLKGESTGMPTATPTPPPG